MEGVSYGRVVSRRSRIWMLGWQVCFIPLRAVKAYHAQVNYCAGGLPAHISGHHIGSLYVSSVYWCILYPNLFLCQVFVEIDIVALNRFLL